jgi:hypothetical protein
MILILLGGSVSIILVVAIFGHEFVRKGISGSVQLIWGLGQDLCAGLQHISGLPSTATLVTFIFTNVHTVLEVATAPFVWYCRKLLRLETSLLRDQLRDTNDNATPVSVAIEPRRVQCSGMAAEKRCKNTSPLGALAPWFCKSHVNQAVYLLSTRAT